MYSHNMVILKGYLPELPLIESTKNGTPVWKYDLKVKTTQKDESGKRIYEWFHVTTYGKTAQDAHTYFRKDDYIEVRGYLKRDTWKKDNQFNEKVYVIAQDIQLLERKEKAFNPDDYADEVSW